MNPTPAQRIAARVLSRKADTTKKAESALRSILKSHDVAKLFHMLEKEGDKQSADLVRNVYENLADRLTLTENEDQALNRLMASTQRMSGWDTATHRNNIFKAADLLGMKLPSYMFASTQEKKAESIYSDLPLEDSGVIDKIRNRIEALKEDSRHLYNQIREAERAFDRMNVDALVKVGILAPEEQDALRDAYNALQGGDEAMMWSHLRRVHASDRYASMKPGDFQIDVTGLSKYSNGQNVYHHDVFMRPVGVGSQRDYDVVIDGTGTKSQWRRYEFLEGKGPLTLDTVGGWTLTNADEVREAVFQWQLTATETVPAPSLSYLRDSTVEGLVGSVQHLRMSQPSEPRLRRVMRGALTALLPLVDQLDMTAAEHVRHAIRSLNH